MAVGYGLADLLTTDLAQSKKLQVVDRVQVNAVLREIGLVDAGRIDSNSAREWASWFRRVGSLWVHLVGRRSNSWG